MPVRRVALILLFCLFVSSAGDSAAGRVPKNVILLIGDGMGFGQTTLARLALGKPDAALNMDSMRYAAFVKTHSAGTGVLRAAITDSAAAATAIATGHKTKNGMLGVTPDGRPVPSVLEAAQRAGKAVGLVTTVTVTHATPAGFGAHVSSRGDEPEIAPQYLDKRIDVILGGGEAYFLPRTADGSKRKDDRDLLAEARSIGYTVVRTHDEMSKARGPRLLGLFHKLSMNTAPPEPSLAQMASKALELLSRSRRGFFAMIEGGQIDYRSHANDAPGSVQQTYDFDDAAGVALQFARDREDTLVIVTADHETGGLAIVGAPSGSNAEYHPVWGTKGHSATVVPLLADGPGAERFSGVIDNTDIAKRIAQVCRLTLERARRP